MIEGKNKQIYFESSVYKQLNIEVIGSKCVIENSMREQDTFTLTETLNDGTELKFGSCLPNQISFTAHDIPAGLIGKNLRPVEILEGNENEPFTYGEYKIYSDTPTADRTKRQIVAYDAMYDIINSNVKSWYDGLSFPMTLKAFRDSFFAHLGIEQKETSLVNDSMTVNKTLVTTQSDDSSVTAEATISGKTIIEAICEINGAFGNIGRDGKFEYVILKAITSALYPAEDLYPREDLFPSDANTESMTGHYITFDYEAFQSQAITQLEIRADDSTAGAIVGTSGNNYVISGNFLISDKTGAEMKQIANNLLPVIAQAEYTPIKSCTCVGNPCLELGDPIHFNTSREIVETYILQRTLTGVQSKRDSIVSAGTETHAMKNPTTRETVEALKRRTHILEENADHLQSTYEDLEKQTNSKFEQTADAITAEVTRAQGAEGTLNASLSLKLGRDENDQVVSMINASADQIILQGNRLIVECTNFGLDYSGQVHIIDSLLFDSGDAYGVEILGHDGQHNALLQNVNIDLESVTGADGSSLATKDDIPDIPDMSDYVTTSSLNNELTNYINNVDAYEDSGKGTTFYYSIQHSGHDLNVRRRAINTSDERLKVDILPLADLTDIYMSFEPISYHFNPGLAGYERELQYGLSAQKIEKSFKEHGITDNALVWKVAPDRDFHEDVYTEGDLVYHLDKDQLHAMHIQMIQKQQHEIEQLKSDNFALKGEVDILKQRLGKMEEMLNVINSKIN